MEKMNYTKRGLWKGSIAKWPAGVLGKVRAQNTLTHIKKLEAWQYYRLCRYWGHNKEYYGQIYADKLEILDEI